MRRIEIEITDDGDVVTIKPHPAGRFEYAENPHELVTVDYDDDDDVCGLELVGNAAREFLLNGLIGVRRQLGEDGDGPGTFERTFWLQVAEVDTDGMMDRYE